MVMLLISAEQSLLSVTRRKANLQQLDNASHISLFHLLTVKQNLCSKSKRSTAKIAKNSRVNCSSSAPYCTLISK